MLPAGTGNARDQPRLDRIGPRCHDDRDGRGLLFYGDMHHVGRGQDDIGLQPHEFRRERGQAIHFAFRPAQFERDVPPLDPALFLEALAKRFKEFGVGFRRTPGEPADAAHISRRLRPSIRRGKEHACAEDEKKVSALVHSITRPLRILSTSVAARR